MFLLMVFLFIIGVILIVNSIVNFKRRKKLGSFIILILGFASLALAIIMALPH